MRYFLELAYRGSAYHGWQRQPNAVTVQEKVEDALATLLREPVEVVGAGRTDTGVHARQLFAHFDLEAECSAYLNWYEAILNRGNAGMPVNAVVRV